MQFRINLWASLSNKNNLKSDRLVYPVDFVIDKKYLGTPFYLQCSEDGSLKKIYDDSIMDNCLVVGSRELWTISRLYGFKVPKFPSQKYRRFFQAQKADEFVPWHIVLTPEAYKFELQTFVSSLKKEILHNSFEYYYKCFVQHDKLFKNLRPAKINSNFYMNQVINSDDSDEALKTFAPKNGYSDVPRYSRISTKTGRLKIKSGPMILHVHKKNRKNIFESRFKGGSVYQLDYTSMEPRILLAVTHNLLKANQEDIYADICDDFSIPRDKAKTAVLSRIYGSSVENVAMPLKSYVDYPEDFIEYVDDYFGIQTLRKKLLNEFRANEGKSINNFYGRYINCEEASEHALLNYFVQSTAVDVCLFGFTQIVERLENANVLENNVPLFVLHDALFIDVHPDYKFILDKLCKAGSTKIPKFESINFFLKPERIV